MVMPNWESFSGPNDEMSNEEQELIKEVPGELQDSEKPEAEKPQWGNFDSPETYQGEIDPTAEESTIGYFVRNIAANASRLGEQVLGRRGNIEKMGMDILTNMPESGGLLGYALSELVGPEGWERMIRGKTGNTQLFPTSEQLKEASEQLTGGYTKPKTEGEKKFQGLTEDIGSTFTGGRQLTPRNFLVNNLGIPAASNVVQDVVEGLGFGKDKATYSKLGTWLALSLAGNVNAPQYASQLMNQGRNGIPDSVQINVPRMRQRLQTVSNNPHLLHADPRTALARQEISAIENDLANGQTTVRSLMTSYDGVNAAKRNRGLFELGRNDQAYARRVIDEVRNAVRDEIMDSGASYPQALHSWRNGVQAWAVIHQSRAMTNWVDSLARGPYAKIITGPAAGLFGITAIGGYKLPLIAGPAALAVPAAYKTAQTAYRVWENPNLAQYYWNAIGAAQVENAPAFINNYNKLNKALEKSESSKKKSKSKKQ
jgi:hypothetical protein